jgi:hypothetical protein
VLGPNLVEAYYDLGRAQWFAGQPELARATWEQGAGANRFAPWARRCQELLDKTARGEEVTALRILLSLALLQAPPPDTSACGLAR